MKEKENLYSKVYEIVKKIPKGYVLTYGDVACLLGNIRLSRRVGQALHHNPDPKSIPCHRVVFKDGSTSASFAFGGENKQKKLLENEGVKFNGNKVDMKKYSYKF